MRITKTIIQRLKKILNHSVKKNPEISSKIEKIETEKVFKHWFQQLDLIESKFLLSGDSELSFQVVYLLFPLIESISFGLFGKSARFYLKKLGISHPDLVYKMFRNGHFHSMNPYIMEYIDGTISWGINSSSQSIVIPYDPGYDDPDYPEGFRESEKEFIYEIYDKQRAHASLSLDRLYAHIKYDLNNRKKAEKRNKLKIVVGQKINSPKPSKK